MEIVSKMIGATDLLQLEDYYDVHQVCVAVVDIQNALSKYPNLKPDAECNVKINHWVKVLKAKSATDTISDDEIK